MDKFKFTYWSEIYRMFGSEEIAIFIQRMLIPPLRTQLGLNMVLLETLGQCNDSMTKGMFDEMCGSFFVILEQYYICQAQHKLNSKQTGLG